MIYNANTDDSGNQKLEERMCEELRISPIIAMNKNKIVEVNPSDILAVISAYSSERGVMDEIISIPVDLSLLSIAEIRNTINMQAELGSKKGLKTEAHRSDEDGDDLDSPDDNGNDTNSGTENEAEATTSTNNELTDESERTKLESKFRMYYSRLLFYAFLTENRVKSLDEILSSFENEDNTRIAKNLNLNKDVLVLIRNNINLFILSQLDYKIQNINTLAHDETVAPEERAIRAINKFGKLSESEVPTPLNIATDMVELLSDDCFENLLNDKTVMLDIASKIGEFAIALVKRIRLLGIDVESVKSSILAIPTSTVAYEFTRKIYTVLGLDINCIATRFTSYDLLNVKKDDDNGKATDEIDYEKIARILKQNKKLSEITLDDEVEEGEEVNIEAVVGNPPYQESMEKTSDSPVYHLFMDTSFVLADKVSFITPARFLFNAGKTPKNWNNKVLNDEHFKVIYYTPNSTKVFENVDIKGGVAITFRDLKQKFGAIGIYSQYQEINSIVKKVVLSTDFENIQSQIFLQNKFDLPTMYADYPMLKEQIGSNGAEKRLTTSIFNLTDIFKDSSTSNNDVKIFGLINNNRVEKFINKKYLLSNDNLMKYKVVVPKSNGSGAIGEVLSTPVIGQPVIGHTQSFISIGAYTTELESIATLKYIKSKFARCMLGTLKVTQDNNPSTWSNVPLQDFTPNSDIDWSKSIPEIDKQLYAKYGLSEDEIAFIEEKIKPME